VVNKLTTTGSLLGKKPDRNELCWQKRNWMLFMHSDLKLHHEHLLYDYFERRVSRKRQHEWLQDWHNCDRVRQR
jgi:hypothetical protein